MNERYSDTPYDDAKKRWISIAVFAVLFGIASIAVKYGPELIVASF